MAGRLLPSKVVVLIVEDEPFIRMWVADTLETAGFEVIEAGNAGDMPGSMDGLKLATAVRGRWPPIEIVLTSGHRRVALDALPARCVFISKPYAGENVVATLRQLTA
jgi:two-component system, response regulator PdtaR